MDLRPRQASLRRSIACRGILASAVLLGCGPGSHVDAAAGRMDGAIDGREAGSSGGRGGDAQGGGAAVGGSAVAGAGGAPAADGAGSESTGGVGATGGTGGSGGGAGGGGGMAGVDGAGEFDFAFATDLPVDLPSPPDVAPGPPELARGRVGHWRLDEGRGNVGLDSSGIGNHGGTVNILGPDWKPGRIGMALEFTPMRNTFVVVPSHETIGPADGISVSVWVHAASWAGAPRIVQKGEDDIQYSLRAESDKLRFVLRLAAVTAVEMPLPPTRQWVHLAATYDGQAMRLYQGGNLVQMLSTGGRIAQTFTSLYIGTRSQAAAETEFFAGLIDELIIYERPLSAAEVRLLSEGRSP